MDVKELILEIWEAKGRIKVLEDDLQGAQTKVLKAEADAKGVEEIRAKFLGGKFDALDVVRKAKEVVIQSEAVVKDAQTSLRGARDRVAIVAKEASQFSDEILEGHNATITAFNKALEKTILAREVASEQLGFMKEQLEEKQKALREEGVDLTFDVEKPPKTTYL